MYLKYLSQLGFFSYPSTELPLFINYTPVGIEDYPAGMEDFLVTSSEENSQEDTNDTIWPYKNPKVRLHAIHQAYDSLKKHDNEFTRLFDILIYAVFSDTNGFYGGNSSNPKYPGFIGIHQDLLGNNIGLQEVLIHDYDFITDRLFFLDTRNSNASISFFNSKSRAANGSSRSNMGFFLIKERAIAARLLWPPEMS